MATYLPTSGALAMSCINSVFGGRGDNLNSYRGTTYYKSTGGAQTFSSGAIGFNCFYGTGPSANRVSISYTFSSSTTNASLNVASIGGYSAGNSCITVTVNSGVYLWANSTSSYGLNLTGGTTGDTVKLVNSGYIMGQGGAGAAGSDAVCRAGNAGGPALNVGTGVGITITNNGYIGGGGGGGGTYCAEGGGGGAGGGAGGYGGGAGGSIGGTGGGGGFVDCEPRTGGGGGRIFPGTGGAGGSGYFACCVFYGTAANGGGGGGGGGARINGGGAGPGGTGGSANAVGDRGGCTIAGGGGGGWGAKGGGSGNSASTGGAGGKAINKNGNSVTFTTGCSRVYGAIS